MVAKERIAPRMGRLRTAPSEGIGIDRGELDDE